MIISCLDCYDSPLTGLYDLSLASFRLFLLQQPKRLLKYMSNHGTSCLTTLQQLLAQRRSQSLAHFQVPVQLHPLHAQWVSTSLAFLLCEDCHRYSHFRAFTLAPSSKNAFCLDLQVSAGFLPHLQDFAPASLLSNGLPANP